jgi:hypothetical protein
VACASARQTATEAKRLRHAELGIIDLTYAPLRPRGVADDLSVVVYSRQQ